MHFFFFFSSSLDKELVRLVEEKKARELEEEKTQSSNNHIQVKPIIETIPVTPTPPTFSASDKMNTNDKIDDLLR
jgi:hypothetical protein